MSDDFITSPEAAALAGVSVSRMNVLVRTGRIDAQKFGRDWAISRASTVKWKTTGNHTAGMPKPKR
jgi:Helix-turn-helix domain